jgi:hypothetical protein
MNTDQSLAIMKALADRSRLAIVSSLLERSQYVEEIAQRHDLAPSTVSFHLRKLEKAGLVRSRKEQYYVVFHINDGIFDTTLRDLASVHKVGREIEADRMEAYRRRVLESFFRNGRLEKLPAQHKKRRIVLEQFASRFEPERTYSEQEVTGLIMPLFDDYCTIRRLLVDEGLIRRDGNGYWREADHGSCVVPGPTPLPEGNGQAGTRKGDVRSMAKRMYKLKSPDMGIYQIRNKVNGRIYVGSAVNLEGTRNSRLFQLRMGKVVFSRELQKDLDIFGAESFEFTVLEVLDATRAAETGDRSLAALHLHWLEKLQPFGERGYNSTRAFQRDRERLLQRG